jgi:hypothetical protein
MEVDWVRVDMEGSGKKVLVRSGCAGRGNGWSRLGGPVGKGDVAG